MEAPKVGSEPKPEEGEKVVVGVETLLAPWEEDEVPVPVEEAVRTLASVAEPTYDRTVSDVRPRKAGGEVPAKGTHRGKLSQEEFLSLSTSDQQRARREGRI